jgi:4-hydroxy-3-polyprenylbenzoate decarboxylase
MPAFYNHPQGLDDVVNHVVARVLDQFGIAADFARRWNGEMRAKVARLESKD